MLFTFSHVDNNSYADQLNAIFARVTELIHAAGAAGVNIVCLQEAWTMPFAFATREKEWLEFAESAETGPSTVLLQGLARQYNMVIVSPILERDEKHGGTIWNTAVVIGTSFALYTLKTSSSLVFKKLNFIHIASSGNNGNVIGKHRKVKNIFIRSYLNLILNFTMKDNMLMK